MSQTSISDAEMYYQRVLQILSKGDIPFMLGGTYAVKKYVGIQRETKDMDIFCKAGDYPRILKMLKEAGFKSAVRDSRWVGKAIFGKYYVDIVFGTPSGVWGVDDSWFVGAPKATILGVKVKLIPPEEMIWCKAYIQSRTRHDGADIYHIILKKNKDINWKRLLNRMERHWEILLAHLINFRFIYPSEIEIIPKWLMVELISRVEQQLNLPKSEERSCRGQLFSHDQYQIDIEKWGFKSIT